MKQLITRRQHYPTVVFPSLVDRVFVRLLGPRRKGIMPIPNLEEIYLFRCHECTAYVLDYKRGFERHFTCPNHTRNASKSD